MENTTLRREAIIERGTEVALELYDIPRGRKVMGGEKTIPFEFEGELFSLNISAFWEKSDHFDYKLIDKEGEIVEKECCIDF